MDRRDALKSLTALAGAVGITVTPVTTHEAADITMVILRWERIFSVDEAEGLARYWKVACEGTALEHVRTIVLGSGLNAEIVRSRV